LLVASGSNKPVALNLKEIDMTIKKPSATSPRRNFIGAALSSAAALGVATIATPSAAAVEHSMAVPNVAHRTVKVRGVDIHYRETGPANGPVVLLLHGFPSSSHMFRELMPQLAGKYRVIAPDYPGFGFSGEPTLAEFEYSFGALATLVDEFTQAVNAKSYVLYMQDFGGPVGFRLAVKHPERVKGMIIQNATLHGEGWNPDIVKQFAPFWKDRNAETEKPIRGFLKAETTQFQYTHGATRTELINPDAWTHDQVRLNRPGNDAVQLQYLWNYQDNVAQYPAWQEYLKTKQPNLLIVWGKNDPFFTLAGVDAIKALVPKAKVNIYDAGHFALETHAVEIGAEVQAFLAKATH
jgi:pimeloyl-ACP methyl ester carboxylesterase